MFRRHSPSKPGNGQEENPFLLSFSDLMASLLAIFILALVVMMIQLHIQRKKLDEDKENVRELLVKVRKTVNEIRQIQSSVEQALDGVGLREKSLVGMLESIQKDLNEQGIEVLVTENGTVLRIPEAALSFDLNQFSIQDRYKPAADAIGNALLRVLQSEENRKILDTVFIEGHTDSVPNRREMGNWGLSTYRAISLWLYWTVAPGAHLELRNLKSLPHGNGGIERPLISTSGYADTRPTLTWTPEMLRTVNQGNAADRRIDIRFTLVSEEKEQLEGLGSQFKLMSSKLDEVSSVLESVK